MGLLTQSQAGAAPSAAPVSSGGAQAILALAASASEGDALQFFLRLPPADLSSVAPEEVISTLKQHAISTQQPITETVTANSGRVLRSFWLANLLLVEVTPEAVSELVEQPEVIDTFENFPVELPEPPHPPRPLGNLGTLDASWGLDKIRAPSVWEQLGIDGSGIRVAVLDTGVDISHPDLTGKMASDDPQDTTYPGGWAEFDSGGNLVSGSEPHDTAQHGTHVSGTVLGGDASGTAIGVAPGTTLMHGLILPGGGGTFAQVIAGMEWAIDPTDGDGNPAGKPAHVVSMSWGATGQHDALIEPIENMMAAGVVPVCATGNSGEGSTGSPGNVYHCFGIGATDSNDNIASFSSGGVIDWSASWPDPYIKPDFSAPGVGVLSSVPGGGYSSFSGTSMATPHTAGTVALILAGNATLTVEEIYALLRDTSVDLGGEAQDIRYGWGRIDAFEAVSVAMLHSGVEGYVLTSTQSTGGGSQSNPSQGTPLQDALVVVQETGQSRLTDANGYYKIHLPPGTYTLQVTIFAYEGSEAGVAVQADAFTQQDFTLAPLPTGIVTGVITAKDTGQPIAGAALEALDTPASATTDGQGSYSLELPAGIYDLRAFALGHERVQVEDVSIAQGAVTELNFQLAKAPVVGVLGDTQKQLVPLLTDHNIWGVEIDWPDVSSVAEISAYDAIILARPNDPGSTTFLTFLQNADAADTGVVFLGNWPGAYWPFGITLLQNHVGDPPGQGWACCEGPVFYQITQEHLILKGWKAGDKVVIVNGGWNDHNWFHGYSGTVLGELGTEKAGVKGAGGIAVDEEKRRVLLAALAPQVWGGVPDWTPDGIAIFVNAVLYASGFLGPLSLEPAHGAVGSAVQLAGAGFTPNASVSILFGEARVAEAETDGEGAFSVTFAVPEAPGGRYIITATDVEGISGNIAFTLTPALAPSATVGLPGSVVEVRGTGFGAAEAGIQVTFNGDTMGEAVTTTEKGSFDTSFTVPASAGDANTCDAFGEATNAALVEDVAFFTRIQTAVDAASAGDSILVGPGTFDAEAFPIVVATPQVAIRAVDGPLATTLNAGTAEGVFRIRAPGVAILGFSLIKGGEGGLTANYGIPVGMDGADTATGAYHSVRIEDNVLNLPGYGIGLGREADSDGFDPALVRGNTLARIHRRTRMGGVRTGEGG